MRNQKFALVSIIVIVGMLLVACAPATPQVVEKEVIRTVVVEKEVPVEKKVVETVIVEKVVIATPVPSAGPVYGGSLVAALGAQDTQGFKTWGDSTGIDWEIWSQVYDTFVQYDDDYNIEGRLFESWESPDAKTWTFHVRKGVKWHDGVELTAQHFMDYFEAALDPASGASTETADLYKDAKIEKLDDYTIKMVYPEPDAALLDGFAAQWLSRPKDFNPEKPIGTGPFKFVEWKRNQYVKLARNPDYWRDNLPYLDQLTFMFVPDPSTQKAMLLSGEVHTLKRVGLPDVQELEKNKDIQIVKTPDEFNVGEWYLLMKCSAPPFDNVKVRQAVAYALDREAMLETTFGYGWLKANPVASGSWAYNPNAGFPEKQDLEKAKALMKEAGFDPSKTAIKTKLFYWKEWPENLQICQIVQANLAEIGIEVELQLLEIMQWVQAVIYDHNFEMALTALAPRFDPNDQLGNCYVTDDGSALEWKNEEFMKYWMAGRQTTDLGKRKEAYFKAQEIAAQEAPCQILNGTPNFSAARAEVQNVIRYYRGMLWYEEMWLKK